MIIYKLKMMFASIFWPSETAMIFNNLNILFSNYWFIILITWSVIWKLVALWKCGRNNQLVWFIVLAIVNTLGILEIIYLLFFRKNMNSNVIKEEVNVSRKRARKSRR